MTALVVIPARYGSTRFPGKPLAIIAGHTLLGRVIDLARRGTRGLDVDVAVATDDQRIAEHAEQLGCAAVITDGAITSGSGRALAAALSLPTPPCLVVNLQGDAPFLPASALRQVLDALAEAAAVATPVIRLSWTALDAWREHKRLAPFSGTSCLVGSDGRALWFSKSILPAVRAEDTLRRHGSYSPVLRHLGLYGYTLDALRRFEATPPSRYEQLEGLEQLRLVENGIPIQTVLVEEPMLPISGVDTPEDLRLAEKLIEQHGDPFGG